MNTEVTTLVFALKELCLQKLFGILKLFTVSPLGGHVCRLSVIFLETEIQWETQVGIVTFKIFTKSGDEVYLLHKILNNSQFRQLLFYGQD